MARPRQVSDEQILGAMREQVLSEGPHVSLEKVARSLEVTVPALLKRFGSREALMLQALGVPERVEWIDRLAKGPDDRPLEAQLQELFSGMWALLEQVLPCVSALRESGIDREKILAHHGDPDRARQALYQWLQRARRRKLVTAAEVDCASYAMLGALHARAFHSHLTKAPTSPASRRKYVQDLARVFARALTS